MRKNNKKSLPPYWIDRFLQWRLPEDQFEEVQGDMHELYLQWVEEMSERKATWLYILNALTFFRPLPNRKTSLEGKINQYSQANSLYMISNYFKIGFRNLIRLKGFSFINIAGLATGMACSILILLWVGDEINYDRFHTDAENIYRITSRVSNENYAVVNYPLAAAIQEKMPEIKNMVRLRFPDELETLVEVGEQKFEEKRVVYADHTFFQVFSFPLLLGNSATALAQPDGIILTEQIARKYFGTRQAIGQIIRINHAKESKEFKVAGILQNIPGNSHLQFDLLLPMSSRFGFDNDVKDAEWGGFNFYAYVQLAEQANASRVSLASLEKKIEAIFKQNFQAFSASFRLQPLTHIHLHSKLMVDLEGHGNIQYVRIFSVVAIFILLVACINFMNLATAHSEKRSKEVGLRKVVGATRNQLVYQFMGESLLITFFSLLLAIAMVVVALPVFNDLTGKTFSLLFINEKTLLGLLLVALLTGLIAGSYPALFLSSFQPIHVLKGRIVKAGTGNVFFRNGLVVVQFVISIVLMVSTAVVYKQLQFIKQKNLGYDQANLLYFPLKGDLSQKIEVLRAELHQKPTLSGYSVVSALPTGQAYREIGVEWEGKNPDFKPIFSFMDVDENFVNVFSIQMLTGRAFTREDNTSSTKYIINEKTAQLMAVDAASAIGKTISIFGNPGTIIGVVKDFNFRTVGQSIEPLILRYNADNGYLVARAKPRQLEAAINDLENVWQKLNPSYSFSYGFIDQDLARLYLSERRMGNIFKAFALLAIFISCLGLYGLSAFKANQRIKEIGIRKVLGASIASILSLLSGDFVRLVGLAFIVATPLAWYLMSSWLEDFAYRIDLEWWIFAAAGVVAILIAIVTVSFQSVKAALVNPIKSIKSE